MSIRGSLVWALDRWTARLSRFHAAPCETTGKGQERTMKSLACNSIGTLEPPPRSRIGAVGSYAKSKLQIAKWVNLVGALALACLAPHVKGAELVGQELDKASAEPESYQVPENHRTMHRAVIGARRSVGRFIAALQHPASGQQDFEVKKPFIQGHEVEHIWLSHVRLVGPRFQGRVDNQPQKIRGLKLGQLVSVSPKEISDWLYVDNGKLVGGYTVRAHYNELSPQQKQEFDRAADFKIDKN